MPKKREYILAFTAHNDEECTIKCDQDHYAEQILRGLVHSGYTVTIKEVFREMTAEEAKEAGYGQACDVAVPVPCRV